MSFKKKKKLKALVLSGQNQLWEAVSETKFMQNYNDE